MNKSLKIQNPLYDEYASEYAHAIKDNIYNAQFERPSLISLLPAIENKKILELGCGSGELIDFFIKKRCSHITAVDCSKAMLNIIKKRFDSKVRCYEQNLDYGIPNEKNSSFDLVVSSLTIHYIENIKYLFTDINRVLKEKGYFVFSTHHPFVDFQDPSSENYFKREKIIQRWSTIGKPVEVTFYRRSLSSLFNTLTEAGFCVNRLSEGLPKKQLKAESKEHYTKLTTKP